MKDMTTAIVACPSCSSEDNRRTGLGPDQAGVWWVTWRCLGCGTQHHTPADNGSEGTR